MAASQRVLDAARLRLQLSARSLSFALCSQQRARVQTWRVRATDTLQVGEALRNLLVKAIHFAVQLPDLLLLILVVLVFFVVE
jgi:phosphoribosylformylglycinamidine (FGAM) synthase-like enzyme